MTALLLAAAAAACIPVGGERILARDMARAWPEFAAVAGETPLGYAPYPGVRRLFAPAELVRLGARFGLPGPAPAVCFERVAIPLARERVLAAMRTALALEEARIEIVELSRYPVPEGDVVFSKDALRAPGPAAAPETPVLWRGEVRYAGSRRFPVWARVTVTAPLARVCAVEELREGQPVRADQLREERAMGFPLGRREAASIGDIAGRRPRRSIQPGAVVRLDLLEEARDVAPGDAVNVEVTSGAARLAFTGRAESAGSAGQSVRVRNPATRRTFTARVSGKGTVAVDAGGAKP